jgi:hypothetical protein
MLSVAGELVDGEHTLVRATLTSYSGGFVFERYNFVNGEHSALLALVAVFGD